MATFRDHCDALLSRWVFRAIDAAATAGVGAAEEVERPDRRRCRGRYARVQRAVHALSQWVPRGYPSVHARLISRSGLPFSDRQIRLIAYGTAMTVFLVDSGDDAEAGPRAVLKVCRETLGRRRHALLAEARTRRAIYQRVSAWYADASPLLETHFVIARCPLLSLPATACVQPYIERPHRGVFDSLSKEELVGLASRSPRLRRQLTSFAACSARAIDREGACVDLLGRDNLILVGGPSDARLLLIDCEIHDLREPARPAAAAEAVRRVAYLRGVAAKAGRLADGAGRLGVPGAAPEALRA